MANNPSSPVNMLLIFTIAGAAVLLLIWFFFPQIIQQMAAGVVAVFAFLLGLVFKRKRS